MQFVSEVRRVLSKVAKKHQEGFYCRLWRVRWRQQGHDREMVFLQTAEVDRLDVRDQVEAALLGVASRTKNKLVSWIGAFLSRQQYALYVVVTTGAAKKSSKLAMEFCAGLSDRILNSRKQQTRRQSGSKVPPSETK